MRVGMVLMLRTLVNRFSMKITIVYRYFWPDTAPYALLLKELLPQLVAAGHDIHIVSGYPACGADALQSGVSRNSVEFGCSVQRVPLLPENKFRFLKPINHILFSFTAFFILIFGSKRNVYWSGTTPPVIQSFLVAIASKIRGAKSIYQMQDIYPEIAVASDLMKAGCTANFLASIDNFSIRAFSGVVVLSTDMAATVKASSGVDATIVNNFALGVKNLDKMEEKQISAPLKFVFAGNIGNFQNLEKVVEVFNLLANDDVELHFLGSGTAKSTLMDMARKSDHIHFHGRLSASDAFDFIQACDVGIVSLRPELIKYAFPTKTHSYFAAGLQVFALVEEASELAKTISTKSLGITAEADQKPEFIAQCLRKYVAQLQNAHGFDTAQEEIWGSRTAAQKWLNLIEGLK